MNKILPDHDCPYTYSSFSKYAEAGASLITFKMSQTEYMVQYKNIVSNDASSMSKLFNHNKFDSKIPEKFHSRAFLPTLDTK